VIECLSFFVKQKAGVFVAKEKEKAEEAE
jgi:hypothetical protein